MKIIQLTQSSFSTLKAWHPLVARRTNLLAKDEEIKTGTKSNRKFCGRDEDHLKTCFPTNLT